MWKVLAFYQCRPPSTFLSRIVFPPFTDSGIELLVQAWIAGVQPRTCSSATFCHFNGCCVFNEAQTPYQFVLVRPLQFFREAVKEVHDLVIDFFLIEIDTEDICQRTGITLSFLPFHKLLDKLFRYLDIARSLVPQHQLLIIAVTADQLVFQSHFGLLDFWA